MHCEILSPLGTSEQTEMEEENELVLLDPSHVRLQCTQNRSLIECVLPQPLMERVQAALKEQLTKQRDRLEIELREKVKFQTDWSGNNLVQQQETLKSVATQRENIGVELYGIQQQLARQQMLIEKEQVRVLLRCEHASNHHP